MACSFKIFVWLILVFACENFDFFISSNGTAKPLAEIQTYLNLAFYMLKKKNYF